MVARHPVVVRGRDEVRADEPVGRPAADPERHEQDPERPRPRGVAQRGQRQPGGAGRRGQRRASAAASGGAPYAVRADVLGPVGAAARRTSGHQRQRERGDQPGGPAPARPVGQLGDHGQEHELPGRARRGEHAHDQAAVPHEPAVGHDRAEHEGQRAGADADREAPQQPELPRRGHHQGEPGADGDQDQRRRDDPADAEPLHQGGRERRGQAVDDQVERDRAARGGPRPAEVLLDRLDQRPGRGPERGGGDQRGHGDAGDEPGPVDPHPLDRRAVDGRGHAATA